jgi:hypothetical protein
VVAQIDKRSEIAPFQQFAHHNTEPDFDLIHPGSMLRRVKKHHLMHWVVQKGRAAFHRAQDAALAFDAQGLGCDSLLFSHPEDQCFGLMDIQVVQHEMPLPRLRIARNHALEVSKRILFGACGSP